MEARPLDWNIVYCPKDLFEIVMIQLLLQVLRTLMLSPIGTTLTNDSVGEIMLSCLRICFETRLSGKLEFCFFAILWFICFKY